MPATRGPLMPEDLRKICPHSQHEKERKPGIEDVMESLRDLDARIYELLDPPHRLPEDRSRRASHH